MEAGAVTHGQPLASRVNRGRGGWRSVEDAAGGEVGDAVGGVVEDVAEDLVGVFAEEGGVADVGGWSRMMAGLPWMRNSRPEGWLGDSK